MNLLNIKKSRFLIISTILIISGLVAVFIQFRYILPKKKKAYPIQKVYVINLDRSKDRWDKIHNDLTREGIEHVRYPAVDGLKLRITSDSGQTFTGADLKSGKYKIRLGETYKVFCPTITLTYRYKPWMDPDPMSAGELGCFCSHVEVMREIVRGDYKVALVFEDDAVIPMDFKKKLGTLSSNLFSTKSWTLVTMAPNIMPNLKIKKIPFNNHFDILSTTVGLYSYIASVHSAEKMLNMVEDVFTRIDVHLFLYEKGLRFLKSLDVEVNHAPVDGSNIGTYMGKCGVAKDCRE